MNLILIGRMNKKRYIKPEMEILSDAGAMLLTASNKVTDEQFSRQQDNFFAEDDDNYEE